MYFRMNFNLLVFHSYFPINLADRMASCPSLAFSSKMDYFLKNFDLNLGIKINFESFVEGLRLLLLFFFVLPLAVLEDLSVFTLLTAFFIFPSLGATFLLFLFKVMQLFSQLHVFSSKPQLRQLSLLVHPFLIFQP